MASFAQGFMVKVLSQLNFPREVKLVFLATRLHKFCQSEVNQFFLGSEVGELVSFIEQGLVQIKNNLHSRAIEKWFQPEPALV